MILGREEDDVEWFIVCVVCASISFALLFKIAKDFALFFATYSICNSYLIVIGITLYLEIENT